MKTNSQLFKDMTFSIYEYGSELAPKRSKILRDIIEKNGGKFIKYADIKASNIPDSIISVKKLNLNGLYANPYINEEKFKESFIDLKWITDCINENFLIDRSNYRIQEEDLNKIKIESDSNGKKRKSGVHEIDISEKRQKTFNSEMKKPSSYTRLLLEKIQSEKKENNNSKENKSIRVKYFDKLYFSQQILNDSTLTDFPLETTNENLPHKPEKTNNLSKIAEISECESSLIELSSYKKLNKPLEKLLDCKEDSIIEKENKINDGINNDNLFDKIKKKLFEKDSNEIINENNEDDDVLTEKTNFDDNEEFFDRKIKISSDDDLISFISRDEFDLAASQNFKEDENNTDVLNKKIIIGKNKDWRRAFACSIENNNSKNLNEHITSQLEEMLQYHTDEKHQFESNAYRKAITILKRSREKITVVDDIKKYKYLGKSISGKIKEILLTGKIRKVNFLKNNDERTNVCRLFMKVHGIGITAANKFYKKGYRTIEDLRQNIEELNQSQKLGLKYFEDSQIRIPREECEQIFNKIKDELFLILPENIIEIVLCGSYRRGKTTCGDMDILITRKDNGGIDGILSSLISSLTKIGLIKDIFSSGKTSHDNYTFMGIMQVNESLPNRRVDIKVYKRENFAFAMLYFTGSPYFNRSIRLLASKLGYSLSDQTLQKVSRINNEKISKGELVKCDTEEDIFRALGLSYKAPIDRDI